MPDYHISNMTESEFDEWDVENGGLVMSYKINVTNGIKTVVVQMLKGDVISFKLDGKDTTKYPPPSRLHSSSDYYGHDQLKLDL